MQIIQLNSVHSKAVKGFMALIDDEDFEKISKYKWHISDVTKNGRNTMYAHTTINGNKVSMHRLIIYTRVGLLVDHKNGNGLDNRKENLRICTRSQNLMNRDATRKNIYGYKGVESNNGRFSARIKVDGKRHYLGTFATPKEAAVAYNEGALKYHGEFAKLNKIIN